MKVKVKIEKEIDLKILTVKANVRYWEDAEINGVEDTENGDNVPCKSGDLWCPDIGIETGRILNWTQGKTAKIHYKVCDECGYELKDENLDIVLSALDGYVPRTLYPAGNGYGDYIIMNIDEDGIIEDWNFDFSDFED